MTWVRLDDGFPDHPKVAAAGPLAAWLYVCGLAYSARLLTDGFIPAAQARRLADVPEAGALAVRLVEVGLWEVAKGGYRIHDYLDYQPSAERIRHDREQGARRQAEWRDRHPAPSNNGVTDDVRNAVTPGAPLTSHVRPSNLLATATGDDDARARAGDAPDDDEGSNLADAMDPLTVDAARAVWQPVSERLRGEMHARNHAQYIQPVIPLGIADDGALLLSTANPLLLEQAARFREQMKRALADIPDAPRDVRLVAQ